MADSKVLSLNHWEMSGAPNIAGKQGWKGKAGLNCNRRNLRSDTFSRILPSGRSQNFILRKKQKTKNSGSQTDAIILSL